MSTIVLILFSFFATVGVLAVILPLIRYLRINKLNVLEKEAQKRFDRMVKEQKVLNMIIDNPHVAEERKEEAKALVAKIEGAIKLWEEYKS